MSYNEQKYNMIHDLIDGDLPSHEEDSLLSAMIGSQDLKDYFRSCMVIRNETRPLSLAAIPPDLTKSVMSMVPVAQGSFVPLYKKVFNFGTAKYLLSMIMGATLLFLLQQINFEQVSSSKIADTSQLIKHSEVEKTASNIAIPKGEKYFETTTNNNISRKADNHKLSIASDPVREYSNTVYKPIAINLSDKSHIFTSNNSNRILSPENIEFPIDIDKTGLSEIQYAQPSFFSGFNIKLFETKYIHFKTPTINPKYFSPLNNYAIAIGYKISDMLSVGAEIRQETFYQRFEGYSGAQKKMYEQQPNLLTTSAFAEFKPIDISDNIHASLYSSIGANPLGIVSRAGLSLEYQVGRLGIGLGLEYSRMDYKYQNTLFKSEKFGILYGLSYEL